MHEPAPTRADGGDVQLRRVLVILNVQYLLGDQAQYLKKGSIRRTENGQVVYDVRESKTDVLTGLIGVALEF